ncbi:GNAT family N-acetyltransferase [Pseudoclavibacter albus]|uniref:GNAT family N-acetyltransferase n=1 Tax=Pseudoclavibacter albus TaxID=272241 RepID=UPI0009FB0CCB|nr:GNAT family N-acetyltransferase [Pseudoclavibacter alba]
MDSQPGITIAHNPARSRVVAIHGGEEIGFMSYREDAGAIVIDHTIVDPRFQGQGVASQLVREGLTALAEASPKRVVAACSYVRIWLGRHPEFAHLTEW